MQFERLLAESPTVSSPLLRFEGGISMGRHQTVIQVLHRLLGCGTSDFTTAAVLEQTGPEDFDVIEIVMEMERPSG